MKKLIVLIMMIILLSSCWEDIYRNIYEHDNETIKNNFYTDFTFSCNNIWWEVYYKKIEIFIWDPQEKIVCMYNNTVYRDLGEIKKLNLVINNAKNE